MKVAPSSSTLSRWMYFIRLAIFCALPWSAFNAANAADGAAPADAARAKSARIQAMRKERPDDGALVFYESVVRVSLAERETAFELLRSLKGRKLGLIPVHDSWFDAVWDDPEVQAIRKELEDEEPETSAAPVAFRLADAKLIPEGIAFDAKGKRFFLGSIAQQKIIVTDAKGEARFFQPRRQARRGSRTHSRCGPRTVRGRRQEFRQWLRREREDRASQRRRPLRSEEGSSPGSLCAPEAVQLNDLAVAPNGTLYVTDSMSCTLFRRKPHEAVLTRFGETGALRGANGIAVAPDGKLYVTLATGIARIDTATGKPTRLPQPDTVVTGGCDGLDRTMATCLACRMAPTRGALSGSRSRIKASGFRD